MKLVVVKRRDRQAVIATYSVEHTNAATTYDNDLELKIDRTCGVQASMTIESRFCSAPEDALANLAERLERMAEAIRARSLGAKGEMTLPLFEETASPRNIEISNENHNKSHQRSKSEKGL